LPMQEEQAAAATLERLLRIAFIRRRPDETNAIAAALASIPIVQLLVGADRAVLDVIARLSTVRNLSQGELVYARDEVSGALCFALRGTFKSARSDRPFDVLDALAYDAVFKNEPVRDAITGESDGAVALNVPQRAWMPLADQYLIRSADGTGTLQAVLGGRGERRARALFQRVAKRINSIQGVIDAARTVAAEAAYLKR
jgi:hypothetical protein